MTEQEEKQVIAIIEAVGYYGSFNMVEQLFDWDEETIKINIKTCLDISNDRHKNN